MRRVDLAPLVAKTRTHPRTKSSPEAATPIRIAGITRTLPFRTRTDVQPNARVDVPKTQARDDREDADDADREERGIEVERLFRNGIRFVRPREHVILPDEHREEQEEEGDGQKRDVAFHEPNDLARPS